MTLEQVSSQPAAPWLGILGGMGPQATCQFLDCLIHHTSAGSDQGHVPVVMHSVPQIPSRSDYIMGRGEDPWPWLLDAAKRLEAAGASLLVMPCNTAHYWFERLQSAVSVPWLHIVDCVGADIERALLNRPIRRIGLLATSGTLEAGIYQARLQRLSLSWLHPSAERQAAQVDAGIRLAKAGRILEAAELLLRAERELIEMGADAVVLACTEVPIALAGTASTGDALRVDSVDSLARHVVERFLAASAPTREVVNDGRSTSGGRPATGRSNPARGRGM